jgi:hypothetical protein
MSRLKVCFFILSKPPGYNTPTSVAMLWNQWLHQGFLWHLWSFEFYSDNQRDIP